MYKLLHIPTGTYIYRRDLVSNFLYSSEEVEKYKPNLNFIFKLAIFSSKREIIAFFNDHNSYFPLYDDKTDSNFINYEIIEIPE